uniref:Uncharacterized protein n=1 Tax=Strongyloides venezuelensis TaxID=75913 RepID=A0A0K0ETY5_STRVS
MKFFVVSAIVLAFAASSNAFIFGSLGASGGCGCAPPPQPACGSPCGGK